MLAARRFDDCWHAAPSQGLLLLPRLQQQQQRRPAGSTQQQQAASSKQRAASAHRRGGDDWVEVVKGAEGPRGAGLEKVVDRALDDANRVARLPARGGGHRGRGRVLVRGGPCAGGGTSQSEEARPRLGPTPRQPSPPALTGGGWCRSSQKCFRSRCWRGRPSSPLQPEGV